MNTRLSLIVVALCLACGLVLGFGAGAVLTRPQVNLSASAVELGTAEQDDYIITVAEAYAGDHDVKLATDRLARLHETQLDARVERLAVSYAPQADLVAVYLARLAVDLGSGHKALVALAATPTPEPERLPAALAAAPRVDSALPTIAKMASVPSKTPALKPTAAPPKALAPPLPTTKPVAAPAAPAAPARPAPGTEFLPDKSRWPSSISFTPASAAPGQGYWHLKKAVYCDAFDKSDPRVHDFGCDEMPGGSAGTNIYVMAGNATLDVIRPDGANVGCDASVVGDKKAANDMCGCTYSFEAANYRISVAGAPSDAIGGFCMCSVNFGWGSRAHVRYFLYFEYITR